MIRIISGTYGLKEKNGAIELKTSKSNPFTLPTAEEERLIKRGVAERCAEMCVEPVATASMGDINERQGNNMPPLNEMKADALRELMKQAELELKPGMSKNDMIAALDEYYREDDEDHPPIPGAFDPVI